MASFRWLLIFMRMGTVVEMKFTFSKKKDKPEIIKVVKIECTLNSSLFLKHTHSIKVYNFIFKLKTFLNL